MQVGTAASAMGVALDAMPGAERNMDRMFRNCTSLIDAVQHYDDRTTWRYTEVVRSINSLLSRSLGVKPEAICREDNYLQIALLFLVEVAPNYPSVSKDWIFLDGY